MHYEIEVDLGREGAPVWTPMLEGDENRTVQVRSDVVAREYADIHQRMTSLPLRVIRVADDGERVIVHSPRSGGAKLPEKCPHRMVVALAVVREVCADCGKVIRAAPDQDGLADDWKEVFLDRFVERSMEYERERRRGR